MVHKHHHTFSLFSLPCEALANNVRSPQCVAKDILVRPCYRLLLANEGFNFCAIGVDGFFFL